MDNDLISIVVPVYNSEQFLSACLNSLLSQTYCFFEIIVVDDGSTDSSGRVCDSYAEKDKRVKVFHQRNGGVSKARNLGLSKASGKWVLFCDSDDQLFPDSLEVLYSKTRIRDDVEMVIAGYTIYGENNSILFQMDQHDDIIQDREMGLMMMYKPLYCSYHGYICSKLYLREIIMQKGICFDENIYFNEDRLFSTKYLSQIRGSIIYCTQSVYKYFIRNTSAMSSKNNSFNRKFVTDFDAYILMYKSIRSQVSNKELTRLARRGVFLSYSRIKDMMKQFGVKDMNLQLHLFFGLMMTNSYRFVVLHKLSKLKSLIYS